MRRRELTSVHDPTIVHVFERSAKLHKVFPNRSLWDQPLLLLEVFDHPGEVPRIRQLEHNVELERRSMNTRKAHVRSLIREYHGKEGVVNIRMPSRAQRT